MYYSITSPQNQQLKRWKKLHTKKGRNSQETYLIEGIHLFLEAKKAGVKLESIMVDTTFTDVEHLVAEYATSVPIYQLHPSLFSQLVETEQSQGIVAEVRLPSWNIKQLLPRMNCVLVLDAIQDPGNLGTMIRTAWAAGVGMVVLGHGTVDPYNSKVVRASMGGLLHLPVIETDLSSMVHDLKTEGFVVVGTSPHIGIYAYEYTFPERVAIIFGNEGRGIQPELLTELDQAIMVPMPSNAESYNVAVTAGMVLYEYIRQKTGKI